ncbi:hypothetical protein DRO69_10025, partial [Candidatus Bathyarchaeota archaeon]
MKRPLLFSLVFSLLFLALTSFHVNTLTADPETNDLSALDIQIDHAIQILDGGLIVLNDKIKLSLKPNEQPVTLKNFSIGFPFQYKFNLDYSFAYETPSPDEHLNVELDVGLGKIGFYAINVIFDSPVDISANESYEFTATFVFSNLVSQLSTTSFNVTFPLYPSLVQDADTVNVTITLPTEATYQSSSYSFNSTTIDSAVILTHTRSPLENFTMEPAWLTFISDDFTIIEMNKIERQLMLDQWGNLFLADQYQIINKGTETLSTLEAQLPQNAYSISVRDAVGNLKWSRTEKGVTVNFRNPLNKNEKTRFTVAYQLPRENYVEKQGWYNFKLTFDFFKSFDWTVRKLTITVTLPEGAEFQSASKNPNGVQKSALREVVTFVFLNATPFHDLSFDLTYKHLVFWASFRPTLWMGVLVFIVAVIAFLWRAPRAPRVPTIPVPPKDIRKFVDIYEKKTRRLRELESIERQAAKGKISRRQYRVRKRTLENRISVMSRDLTALREKMSSAGPRYADMMRQIEVAETRLMGAETDIRRLEARYRRGEISKEAYRRL